MLKENQKIQNKEKNNKKENQLKELKDQLCKIYGACGSGMPHQNPQEISHFGLKKLNEKKS